MTQTLQLKIILLTNHKDNDFMENYDAGIFLILNVIILIFLLLFHITSAFKKIYYIVKKS